MENNTKVKCSKCGKEEDNYWIEKFGMCFWCHHELTEAKAIVDLRNEVKEKGSSSNEEYIICPYCGCNCSTDDLYESTITYCDECNKKFNLEIEYTASYSTSKLKDETKKIEELK